MEYNFFALISRMKYIDRWALMRNNREENLCEHCLEVSMIAHALATIGNVRYGKTLNAERAALIGLYHDASEIITGDMPTPVKYYNDDIKTVRAMITMYGMSDKFGLMQLETVQGKYLDRNAVLQCSDKTAAKVDEEIRNQLKKAYDEAKKLLSEHMNALDAIAQYLIEKESITGQEFMEIFNRVENAEQNVEQE